MRIFKTLNFEKLDQRILPFIARLDTIQASDGKWGLFSVDSKVSKLVPLAHGIDIMLSVIGRCVNVLDKWVNWASLCFTLSCMIKSYLHCNSDNW